MISQRWGDANVHTIGAALFAGTEHIHFLEEIGYVHDDFTHCPTGDVWKRGRCTCDPNPSRNVGTLHITHTTYNVEGGLRLSLIYIYIFVARLFWDLVFTEMGSVGRKTGRGGVVQVERRRRRRRGHGQLIAGGQTAGCELSHAHRDFSRYVSLYLSPTISRLHMLTELPFVVPGCFRIFSLGS